MTGVIGAALGLALQPATWRSTVRNVLLRQIYFTGVEALPVITISGLAVGISAVTQAGVWLVKMDQPALFGPLVTAVVIQNLGPLLVNFFVISRSGAAITVELGNMVINQEVKVLESQGIDPFVYLVVPRIVGVLVSVLCLTIAFVSVALLGGYLFSLLLDIRTLPRRPFAESIFLSMPPEDILLFGARTLLPGLVTGAICCTQGLSIEPVVTAVPQASTRAMVRSVSALFIVSVLITLLELL